MTFQSHGPPLLAERRDVISYPVLSKPASKLEHRSFWLLNCQISQISTAVTIILLISCRDGTLALLLVPFQWALPAFYLASCTLPHHLRRFVSRYSSWLSSFPRSRRYG